MPRSFDPGRSRRRRDMMNRTSGRAIRGTLLGAGIAVGAAFTIASAANAGECPADKRGTDLVKMDTSPAKGVSDTVLAAIKLADEPAKIQDRELRLRKLVIGLTAFLTVVDLFATQAILPSLTKAYHVTPAAMGLAVNASTLGMAVAGLAVAFFSRSIDRRLGILLSLTLLSIPTALLASAPDLTSFALLRIAQGLFMSTAFALTLAYLGEACSAEDAGSAFAAYITGNVASNLIGRLISAAVADHLGLATNFYVFAALNLAGAVLVYFTVARTKPMEPAETLSGSPLAVWGLHLRNPQLRASFAIGFLILFAFIGTFTYRNFVLVREPYAVGPMALGFVYLVFLPSIFTTPAAGQFVQRFGTRPTFWCALAVAGIGLPLLLLPRL